MFLMYVDESGDTGLPSAGSPTRYYCLSGLVVHELYWQTAHRQLVTFRQRLSQQYRVHLEDELHSAELIRLGTDLAPSLRVLRKHERLSILRQHADEIAAIPGFSIINVVVDKATGKQQHADEVFKSAWYRLFQRFENTIAQRNFPGANYDLEERGMVFPDSTHAVALGKHLSDMRLANRLKIKGASGSFSYIDRPLTKIIEEPIARDSRHSFFIQAADCAVFLLKQFIQPNGYMKAKGGSAYFKRLEPVLCKRATQIDPWGIVRG